MTKIYRYLLMFRDWDKDRVMYLDIDAVTKLLKEDKIWFAVKNYIDDYNSLQHLDVPVFSPTAYVFRGSTSKDKTPHSHAAPTPNVPALPAKLHSPTPVAGPLPAKRSRRHRDGDANAGGSNNSSSGKANILSLRQ
ncbi:Histidine ammonia-lyase [Orchesella cincta]|uniref:Histidine ammonia-lyase n=1 Tax=Orchesella cincta TaxID=48709 RepID=A0A1D2NK38_ORCCI|nr:Histidine ammonia-lyase [Orchesella cincta]